MSKAYVEARELHGQSELLDEIVAAKPKADHTWRRPGRPPNPEPSRIGGV